MSQALATQKVIGEYLKKYWDEVAKLLPDGEKPERVLRMVRVAIMDDPKILRCDPKSIFRSVCQAAIAGVDVGKSSGESYLIPYGQECTLQISYRGMVKSIMRRSKNIRNIHGGVAYEKDSFEYSDAPPMVKHSPSFDKDHGDLLCAYAVAYDNDLRVIDVARVMPDDLKKARELADRGRPSPAWKSWPDQMRAKVAIKRLCKTLPLDNGADTVVKLDSNPNTAEANVFFGEDVVDITPPTDSDGDPPPHDPDTGELLLEAPRTRPSRSADIKDALNS